MVSYEGIKRQIKTKVKVYNSKSQSAEVEALWDTGATHSCIDTNIAKILSLTSKTSMLMGTPYGQAIRDKYIVNISLSPDLIFENIEVIATDIMHTNIGAIIGMDIISQGVFLIDNSNRQSVFKFEKAKN